MKAFTAHGIFSNGRGLYAKGDLIDVVMNLTEEEAASIRERRNIDLRPITIMEGDLSEALLKLIAEAQAAMPGWPRARS